MLIQFRFPMWRQMRIQIISDLHLEFSPYRIRVMKNADVLVIAGDFTVAKSLEKLEGFARSAEKPILFVAGNHEYYGGVVENVNERLEEMSAKIPNFLFLNNKCVQIGNVRFAGSTLWSNFDLHHNPVEFTRSIGLWINDFALIRKSTTHRFSPTDCWRLNEVSRHFLKNIITRTNANRDSKTVIVTHFCPSPKSIHSRYKDDPMTPYFCCNCEDYMLSNVPLWIHGHTHQSIDYVHNRTRVIANPRGYYGGNKRFNGQLLVEI